MHFSRLRLTGFKSFVDPTDLLIEPDGTRVPADELIMREALELTGQGTR